jgi:hypothetical protein
MDALWTANPGLADAARWRLSRSPARAGLSAGEIVALIDLGIIAALLTCLPLAGLRIPGHAILRGALPMILGISLVPRRSSGSIMSLAAAATFVFMQGLGPGAPNVAAWAGLLCLGPAADFALAGAKPGWTLYARCALAGLAANLVSFAIRLATGPKFVALATAATGGRTWAPGSGMGGGRGMGGGGGMGGGRGLGLPVENFWLPALVSFAVCGAVAGLVCAAIWFRIRPRQDGSAAP